MLIAKDLKTTSNREKDNCLILDQDNQSSINDQLFFSKLSFTPWISFWWKHQLRLKLTTLFLVTFTNCGCSSLVTYMLPSIARTIREGCPGLSLDFLYPTLVSLKNCSNTLTCQGQIELPRALPRFDPLPAATQAPMQPLIRDLFNPSCCMILWMRALRP